jgi:hypothetical protein
VLQGDGDGVGGEGDDPGGAADDGLAAGILRAATATS